jgi:hypothetical protein
MPDDDDDDDVYLKKGYIERVSHLYINIFTYRTPKARPRGR